MSFKIFSPRLTVCLESKALHKNVAALGSAKIMRIKASTASIIDVRGMMNEMAINISNERPSIPHPIERRL